MAIVRNPFFSVWASGSIGKQLTCQADNKFNFVMRKHPPLRRKIIGGQAIVCKIFKWRAKRMNILMKHKNDIIFQTSFFKKDT